MPLPKRGLDQHYAIEADAYFENHESEARERQARALLDEAVSLVGGSGRLLDVGSGRGEILKAARDTGWDALGLEPSPTFAARAREYSGAELFIGSIEEYEGPSGSFDVVVLAAVLEHLYDPAAVISKVSRLLRSGGALFLDVPNEQGLYFQVGNLYQRLRGRDWVVNLAPTFAPYHTFGFGPKSLRALLARFELSPVRWRTYGGTAYLSGGAEAVAARAISALSRGNLGNYIETWARRT
jgi:SAM-dependent methyltransferase